MVQRIARRWFLLSVAGISLYIALYAAFFGFEDIHIAGISAVLLSALGISIILALDDPHTQGNETAENIKDITFAGLAYILLVKRKPLLALLVISVVGVGLTTYYAFKSLGVTLETEGSALTIKLPGQTVYYFPIHSQWGWQNTGIVFKGGEKFKYSLAGYVSPGYLQDIDLRLSELRKHKLDGKNYESAAWEWPVTGPEGYGDDDPWYEKTAKHDKDNCNSAHKKTNKQVKELCYSRVAKNYKEDDGLTIKGIPHNRVVGIFTPPGQPPKGASRGKSGYSFPEDKDRLIMFHSKGEESAKEGELWIVINDADAYRWDNAGLFFIKIVKP